MNFMEFKKQVHFYFRIDLNSYKENQLRRRIDSFMKKNNIENYKDFFRLLKTKGPLYTSFVDYLTINVSEFFRDPKKFETLEKIYLPELIKNKIKLKIWSAACSNGSEPYSIAILLNEQTPGVKHHIEATDVDRKILAKAIEGIYKRDDIKNVSKSRLRRYFKQENDKFRIIDSLKKNVLFKHHDLLQNNYATGFDLILCRNVTIYFTREAQERVNLKFANSLNPGGLLFIGGSEMIFNYQQIGLDKLAPCFYRKTS